MDIAGINLNVGEAITGVGRLAQEIKSLFTGDPTDKRTDRVRFAGFICQKYGLDITFQDAWQLLGGGKI